MRFAWSQRRQEELISEIVVLEETSKVNISRGKFTGKFNGYTNKIVIECFSNIIIVSNSGNIVNNFGATRFKILSI